jgi:hypothetical protein
LKILFESSALVDVFGEVLEEKPLILSEGVLLQAGFEVVFASLAFFQGEYMKKVVNPLSIFWLCPVREHIGVVDYLVLAFLFCHFG